MGKLDDRASSASIAFKKKKLYKLDVCLKFAKRPIVFNFVVKLYYHHLHLFLEA